MISQPQKGGFSNATVFANKLATATMHSLLKNNRKLTCNKRCYQILPKIGIQKQNRTYPKYKDRKTK